MHPLQHTRHIRVVDPPQVPQRIVLSFNSSFQVRLVLLSEGLHLLYNRLDLEDLLGLDVEQLAVRVDLRLQYGNRLVVCLDLLSLHG